MVDTTLLERLIERAVEARMAEMRGALWVHTHLLTELIKQLPKETVLQAALLIDQTWLDLSPPEERLPAPHKINGGHFWRNAVDL
jgi:hypothetical protein